VVAIISTPTAIRSCSRWTAAIILRTSLSITSTMSSAESLSIPSVAGLMASVGRDCHFERTGISSLQFYIPRTPASLVDAYLTHLAVERRLSVNSVQSYARDLVLLQQFSAGHRTPVERLTRQRLEELVRHLMSEGRSPRSSSPAPSPVIGAFTGFSSSTSA
jgi:hypothetical protein